MKQLSVLILALSVLLIASVSSAQTISLSFDEGSILHCVDGRTALVPNPEFSDFPSAQIWVIATEISQVFGYEYNLASTDLTAVTSAPVTYPSAGSNFATLPESLADSPGHASIYLVRSSHERHHLLHPPFTGVSQPDWRHGSAVHAVCLESRLSALRRISISVQPIPGGLYRSGLRVHPVRSVPLAVLYGRRSE